MDQLVERKVSVSGGIKEDKAEWHGRKVQAGYWFVYTTGNKTTSGAVKFRRPKRWC